MKIIHGFSRGAARAVKVLSINDLHKGYMAAGVCANILISGPCGLMDRISALKRNQTF